MLLAAFGLALLTVALAGALAVLLGLAALTLVLPVPDAFALVAVDFGEEVVFDAG